MIRKNYNETLPMIRKNGKYYNQQVESKKIHYSIGEKVYWKTLSGAIIQVEIVDILENNNIFKIQFSSGKTYRASRKQLDDCNNAVWRQLKPGESW